MYRTKNPTGQLYPINFLTFVQGLPSAVARKLTEIEYPPDLTPVKTPTPIFQINPNHK